MSRKSRRLQRKDRSAELVDDRPDVFAMFQYYNGLYFEGNLGSCKVRWSSQRSRTVGKCICNDQGCEIVLSEPLLKGRSLDDLKAALLHEMLHAIVFFEENIRDHGDHGLSFQWKMDEISQSTAEDPQRPGNGYGLEASVQACADAEQKVAAESARLRTAPARFARKYELPNKTTDVFLAADCRYDSAVVSTEDNRNGITVAPENNNATSTLIDDRTAIVVADFDGRSGTNTNALTGCPSAAENASLASAGIMVVADRNLAGKTFASEAAGNGSASAALDTALRGTTVADAGHRNASAPIFSYRLLSAQADAGNEELETKKRKHQRLGDMKSMKAPRLENVHGKGRLEEVRGTGGGKGKLNSSRSPNVIIAWMNYYAYESENEGENLIDRRAQKRMEEKAMMALADVAAARKKADYPSSQEITDSKVDLDDKHGADEECLAIDASCLIKSQGVKCYERRKRSAEKVARPGTGQSSSLFLAETETAKVTPATVHCIGGKLKGATKQPLAPATKPATVHRSGPKVKSETAQPGLFQAATPRSVVAKQATPHFVAIQLSEHLRSDCEFATTQCPVCDKVFKIDSGSSKDNAFFNTHIDECLNKSLILR